MRWPEGGEAAAAAGGWPGRAGDGPSPSTEQRVRTPARPEYPGVWGEDGWCHGSDTEEKPDPVLEPSPVRPVRELKPLVTERERLYRHPPEPPVPGRAG